MRETFKGYDDRRYTVGDRVEVDPKSTWWIRGVRYGVVIGSAPTPKDRVRVCFDKLPTRTFAGTEDTFRKIGD